MNRSLFFRMALSRVLRFKLKSFFMAAGIIISVIAVILVQTIGANIKSKFATFIHDTYPANTVYLAAGNGFMGGGQGSENLKLTNVQAVLRSVEGIESWDPIVFAGMNNVTGDKASAYVSVMGHSEIAETARNRTVTEGVYFSEQDIQQARRVALIGEHAASTLFGNESPVGRNVFYNNVSLEVLGVLARAGVDPHGRDLDNELHLPYTLLKDKILGRNNISGVTFMIRQDRLAQLDTIADEITAVMRREHDLSEGTRNDFTVIHSGIMMKMVDKAYRTFDFFLPLITAIAFLVSAVLILAIMFAVVKERTREIGLRKALGATPASLRWLILGEVLVLSLLGALIGIVLAQITLELLQPMFARKFGIADLATSMPAIVVSVVLALLAGLLGALLPAQRAARMNPVAALA